MMQTGDCRELESGPGDSYFLLDEPHGRAWDVGVHPITGPCEPDFPLRPNGPRTLTRDREALERLLRAARAGQGQALVVRGEAGLGKTTLLQHAGSASGFRVAQVGGVESEQDLPFAGLHRLCAPMLDRVGRLPGPQRDALAAAFGVRQGGAIDRFLVGLAVLGLLAEVSAEQPLVCTVDDAHWLDRPSRQVLAFVARRLGSEHAALVFAVSQPIEELEGLPELVLQHLSDADAQRCSRRSFPAPSTRGSATASSPNRRGTRACSSGCPTAGRPSSSQAASVCPPRQPRSIRSQRPCGRSSRAFRRRRGSCSSSRQPSPKVIQRCCGGPRRSSASRPVERARRSRSGSSSSAHASRFVIHTCAPRSITTRPSRSVGASTRRSPMRPTRRPIRIDGHGTVPTRYSHRTVTSPTASSVRRPGHTSAGARGGGRLPRTLCASHPRTRPACAARTRSRTSKVRCRIVGRRCRTGGPGRHRLARRPRPRTARAAASDAGVCTMRAKRRTGVAARSREDTRAARCPTRTRHVPGSARSDDPRRRPRHPLPPGGGRGRRSRRAIDRVAVRSRPSARWAGDAVHRRLRGRRPDAAAGGAGVPQLGRHPLARARVPRRRGTLGRRSDACARGPPCPTGPRRRRARHACRLRSTTSRACMYTPERSGRPPTSSTTQTRSRRRQGTRMSPQVP